MRVLTHFLKSLDTLHKDNLTCSVFTSFFISRCISNLRLLTQIIRIPILIHMQKALSLICFIFYTVSGLINQGNYLLQSYPFFSPAAPSIVREDVSLPPSFLRRQASLTKRKFPCISPFSKKDDRVIDVV